MLFWVNLLLRSTTTTISTTIKQYSWQVSHVFLKTRNIKIIQEILDKIYIFRAIALPHLHNSCLLLPRSCLSWFETFEATLIRLWLLWSDFYAIFAVSAATCLSSENTNLGAASLFKPSWSAWRSWSPCTTTCGSGQRLRVISVFVCLLVFVCDRLLRFLMFVFFFLSQGACLLWSRSL